MKGYIDCTIMETKYIVYGKTQNRTALGIINAYLIAYPNITLSELREAFPSSLNTDSGVGEIFIEAEVGYKATANWQGYLSQEGDLLHLSDGLEVAVTNMWTYQSLKALQLHAEKLGIDSHDDTDFYHSSSDTKASVVKGNGFVILLEKKHKQSSQMPLKNVVSQDIRAFFSGTQRSYFFNEDHFQHELALYLSKTNNYDEIIPEFRIPYTFIEEAGKKNKTSENNEVLSESSEESSTKTKSFKMYVDIMIRRGEEYFPIELKYPVKSLVANIDFLGVHLEEAKLLRSQSAGNNRLYDFWADVKRIEVLKSLSPVINNGIALFLTNAEFYKKDRSDKSKHYYFSMKDNMSHSKERHWNDERTIVNGRPNFTLSNEYKTNWTTIVFDVCDNKAEEFYYCILEV